LGFVCFVTIIIVRLIGHLSSNNDICTVK